MFLLSAFSAESKKEKNSLRTLRLCGDYKLSNYNTIPYLRIRVLREIEALCPEGRGGLPLKKVLRDGERPGQLGALFCSRSMPLGLKT